MKQVTISAEELERLPAQEVPPAKASRRAWALAFAALVDVVQVALLPLFGEGLASPAEDVLDLFTAGMLTLLLGFDWRLVAAFAAELVPGVDLFPSWTAAVLSISSRHDGKDPQH